MISLGVGAVRDADDLRARFNQRGESGPVCGMAAGGIHGADGGRRDRALYWRYPLCITRDRSSEP